MAQKNPVNHSLAAHKAGKSLSELQEENTRLKDLVVSLSVLVLKNVAHESRSSVHAAAAKEHAHPRSPAEEEEMAEALEAAGEELMAKAVEMKSILKRRKEPH